MKIKGYFNVHESSLYNNTTTFQSTAKPVAEDGDDEYTEMFGVEDKQDDNLAMSTHTANSEDEYVDVKRIDDYAMISTSQKLSTYPKSIMCKYWNDVTTTVPLIMLLFQSQSKMP